MRTFTWASLVVFAAPVLAFGQSGAVELGTPSVAGGTVRVPVSLSGDLGPGVSAMDFRFRYDPGLFEPVSIQAGPAASAADKLVQANVVRPGEYVVLMFGMNQETVSAGQVAQITLRVLDESRARESELSVSNTTISLSNASDIPSTGSSTMVRVGATSPESLPDGPEQEEAPPVDAIPDSFPAPPPGQGPVPPGSGRGLGDGPGETAVENRGRDAGGVSPAAGVAGGADGSLRRELARADELRSGLPEGGFGSGDGAEQGASVSAAGDGSVEGQDGTGARGSAGSGDVLDGVAGGRGEFGQNTTGEVGELAATGRNRGVILLLSGLIGGAVLVSLFALRKSFLR